jgi:hypothetical protein
LPDRSRPPSPIDIRRARLARTDSIEIALLLALATAIAALLGWTWPS